MTRRCRSRPTVSTGSHSPSPTTSTNTTSSASLRAAGALLTCKNREFHVNTGSVVLFQPGDNHGRVKIDESTMDYWGLNIPQETMLTLTEEVTGKRELPGFTVNVLLDEEVNCYLRPLHEMIMAGAGDLDKEENLLLLISLLLRRYGQPFSRSIPPCRDEIECACRFIEEHYAERLSLEEICRCAGLSKSTLLRAFSREKGLTPYSYLENIRISEAKKLLGQGVPPLETALRTGFSDPEPFHELLPPLHRPGPRRLPRDFSGQGLERKAVRVKRHISRPFDAKKRHDQAVMPFF